MKNLEEKQVFIRRLHVERAFHSHHMFPYALTLASLISNINPCQAACRMFSSVTGQPVEGSEMNGTSFAANLTSNVRFAQALTEMLLDDMGEQGVNYLLAVGPHPALTGPSRYGTQSLKLDVPYLATLDRAIPASESLPGCVGQLFAYAYPVDLEAVNSTKCIDPQGSVGKDTSSPKDWPSKLFLGSRKIMVRD